MPNQRRPSASKAPAPRSSAPSRPSTPQPRPAAPAPAPTPRATPAPSSSPPPPPPGAGPDHGLAALLSALGAVVGGFASKPLGATAAALLAALRAIVALAQRAAADPASVRLLAHPTGPVVGVRLAPADPADERMRMPPDGADPELAALHNDLITVLDHHDPVAFESKAALGLHFDVSEALAEAHTAEAPPPAAPKPQTFEQLRQQADSIAAESAERLGDMAATMEKLGAFSPRAAAFASGLRAMLAPPTERPPTAAALGPVHHALVCSALDAIDSFDEVEDFVHAAEGDLRALRRDGAPTGHLESTMEDLRAELWALGGHLALLSHHLSGESVPAPLARHAAALRVLMLLTADDAMRRQLEREAREDATEAFTDTST